jgi:hypothetical protein
MLGREFWSHKLRIELIGVWGMKQENLDWSTFQLGRFWVGFVLCSFLKSRVDRICHFVQISNANHHSWPENVASWGGNSPIDYPLG